MQAMPAATHHALLQYSTYKVGRHAGEGWNCQAFLPAYVMALQSTNGDSFFFFFPTSAFFSQELQSEERTLERVLEEPNPLSR